MSEENRTSLILSKLKEYYNINSDLKFAKFLGIAATTISSWKVRDSFDYDLIYSKCEGIDANWLLTGEGPMLKDDKREYIRDIITPLAIPAQRFGEGIPLIPFDAMAGVVNGDISVLDLDCEHYVVPVFKGADFLIPVKGSSMYPKYSSGDIIACKKLPLNDIFFQWNKVYVVDTIQGPLVKRVSRGSSDDSIMLVSENKSYEPFELNKTELRAVAIVLGVIRLE